LVSPLEARGKLSEASVVGSGQRLNQGGELEDFDVRGAVGPVVAPADDNVTAGKRVTVIAEIPALKFKFDMHALPALGADLALGLTVGESRLNSFDPIA